MSHEPPVQLVQLDYRSPVAVPLPPVRQEEAFKVAMWCWKIPLVVGTCTFLVFLACRPLRDAMFGLGFFTVIIGTFMAGVGAISAIVLLCNRASRTDRPVQQAIVPALFLLLLLGSNFLVAGSMVALADYLVGGLP